MKNSEKENKEKNCRECPCSLYSERNILCRCVCHKVEEKPCIHARPDYRSCPHCIGINSQQNISWREETRRKVEKILWREYNPDFSPNMEAVSEEIMSLLEDYLNKRG